MAAWYIGSTMEIVSQIKASEKVKLDRSRIMSAYFPEESCSSGVFPQELYVPTSIHTEKESNLIEFPTERRVLWYICPKLHVFFKQSSYDAFFSF